MITQEQIEAAIYGVKHSTEALFNAAELLIDVKRQFEIDKAAKIAAGEIVGKNEDERKAAARIALATQYLAVDKAEANERQARHNYDMAQLELEFVRYSLRLMEVTAKAE